MKRKLGKLTKLNANKNIRDKHTICLWCDTNQPICPEKVNTVRVLKIVRPCDLETLYL